jgi:adenine phosphoribosyltransferase
MTLQQKIDSAIRNVPNFPKEGIQFKDITPIMQDAQLSKEIVEELASQWKGKIDAVAGVESRGFLFGFPLAIALNIPFILIRKKGKLPYHTVSYKYDLEYGSAEIEMHLDSVTKGMRVLIHDDLLATGGTALAAAQLIKMQEGVVSGFSFLVELSFLEGKSKLSEHSNNINCLIEY